MNVYREINTRNCQLAKCLGLLEVAIQKYILQKTFARKQLSSPLRAEVSLLHCFQRLYNHLFSYKGKSLKDLLVRSIIKGLNQYGIKPVRIVRPVTLAVIYNDLRLYLCSTFVAFKRNIPCFISVTVFDSSCPHKSKKRLKQERRWKGNDRAVHKSP